MENNNIVIIGSGQLGTRHLQALSLLKISTSIYVLDPLERSLNLAKCRWNEVKSKISQKLFVYFIRNMEELPLNIDVAIVSTNSNVRKKVIEELLLYAKVRYLVLEKFLFPIIKEYSEIENLISKTQTKTFVNCPRRVWPFYRELKERLDLSSKLEYIVSGSNLGLGCNSIHFLDQAVFLTGDSSFTLQNDLLDNSIMQSKREGFVEFTGTLYGASSKGHLFSMSSYARKNVPLQIQINSDTYRCVIREIEGKALVATPQTDWQWNEVKFEYIFQSNLTHTIVEQLLNTGTCSLPTYIESSKLHVSILDCLLDHYRTILDKDVESCPIT